MRNRLGLLPLIAITFTILGIFMPSCGKKETNDPERALIDTVLLRQNENLYGNPTKAEKIFTATQKKLKDSANYYELELFKGLTHFINGDVAGCYKIQSRVFTYCKSHPDAHKLSGLYWNHKGVILQNIGNLDSAVICMQNCYEEALRANDNGHLVDVCVNLADMNQMNGGMVASANWYRRAQFLADSLNAHQSDFAVLTGLGNIYSELGEYTKSNEIFKNAEKFVKKASIYDNFYYYNTYGNSLYYQQQYKDAIKTFKKASGYASKLTQADLIAVTSANLGEVFMLNGQIDSATVYLKDAERRFDKIKALDYTRKFYMNSLLGDLELHKNNLSAAHKYFELKIDTAIVPPRYLGLHFHRLQRYYTHKNDYENAYNSLLAANKYDDSLKNQRVRNQIADMSYRYRQDTTVLQSNIKVSKKEEEVKVLQVWTYGVSFVAVLILIIGVFAYWNRKRKAQIAEMKMQASLTSLKMENMRNRLSPHFLFNVLNREQVNSSIVSLLRKNLELYNHYIVPIKDEIEFIDTYISLESPALGANFNFKINITKDIDLTKEFIPSMMLQIFVENAVKHGLRGYEGEKRLDLNISKDINGNLHINIKNNGNPTSNCAHTDGTGTGLRIVTQTIQILNEHNSNKISLTYGRQKEYDGSSIWNVEIIIPQGYDFSIMQKGK